MQDHASISTADHSVITLCMLVLRPDDQVWIARLGWVLQYLASHPESEQWLSMLLGGHQM